MTGPRYATLSDLRDYVSSKGNLGTAEDGLLTDCILRAESVIDQYTRRTFLGTAGTIYYSRHVAEIRYNALYIDHDLVSLVSLINGDGQTIPVGAGGSVWLEPRNEGPPYRIIRLYSSYVWNFNTDQEITIAGTFGYGTVVPYDIQGATVELAAYYYRLKDVGPGDVAGFDQAGVVQQPRGIPENVRRKIEPYRSRSGGVTG